jgi:hypothetical protein
MEKCFVQLIVLIPVVSFVQTYKKHNLQKDRLTIQFSAGVMNIIAVSDKANKIISISINN